MVARSADAVRPPLPGHPLHVSDSTALFEREGDGFVATALTVGPWDPGSQSGGAVLALLGHVLEGQVLEGQVRDDYALSRLTVDMVRPAPVGEVLRVDVDVLHEDRHTQTIDLVVRAGDAVTTRGRARRVRTAATATIDVPPGDEWLPPAHLEDVGLNPQAPAFLRLGAELRRADEPIDGSHQVWCRLRVPVVAGEPIRATSRAVLPFDLVNKIGASLTRDSATTINPDVSGHIARLPVSDWVALIGHSYYDHTVGHGVSMATMRDAAGDFGVTSTSQLVEPIVE